MAVDMRCLVAAYHLKALLVLINLSSYLLLDVLWDPVLGPDFLKDSDALSKWALARPRIL